MDIEKNFSVWLKKADDKAVSEVLKKYESDQKSKEDAFFKELSFGTGGLRGKLGAGTNRMNIYTVKRATLGLADYILGSDTIKKVAIAYDSRKMSKEFAALTAGVLSSKGIYVYLFDTLMPTPVLSFAVRRLQLGAGIVITASHNPKEYNGYKVYNENGCQITDAIAKKVTENIEKHDYFEDFTADPTLIEYVGESLLDEFVEEVLKCRVGLDKTYLPKIVYTPLNGTGRLPIKKLFAKMGVEDYTVVPEQEYPDGDFTTCPYPNPEENSALDLAVSLAKKVGAELIVATDPDADRMGIATVSKDGSVRLFNGNEAGVLMEYFLLSVKKKKGILPKKPYIVKTIVTTPLADDIARDFSVGIKNVLTGFKYIGEAMDRYDNEDFLFGMEESCGYLFGKYARDKDSVSAVMMITEAAAYYKSKGLSLDAALDKICEKYGYCSTALYYKLFEGKDGMEFMSDYMKNLRITPYKEICGRRVDRILDYSAGVADLPKSNVLEVSGEGFSLIIRPSGTEPKIKFYIAAKGVNKPAASALCRSITEFVKENV